MMNIINLFWFLIFDGTVAAECSTAALRFTDLIPAVVVLTVCLCIFSMFVNASTIQELFIVWGNVL